MKKAINNNLSYGNPLQIVINISIIFLYYCAFLISARYVLETVVFIHENFKIPELFSFVLILITIPAIICAIEYHFFIKKGLSKIIIAVTTFIATAAVAIIFLFNPIDFGIIMEFALSTVILRTVTTGIKLIAEKKFNCIPFCIFIIVLSICLIFVSEQYYFWYCDTNGVEILC